MRNIPMAKYYPSSSLLHSLNAVAKLLCSFLIFAAVILAHTVTEYMLLTAAAFIAIYAAKIPFGAALGGLRRMWLFFIVIFIMNAFFFDDAQPIWQWWIFKLSYSGIVQGANVVLSVALIIIYSGILLAVATPMEITFAFEWLITPLKFFHLPVAQIAMIISVAIQFIPTLLEESDQIRKAQMARGAPLESKNLINRIEGVMSLSVPIFLSAFRRADELAMAMEARGYRVDKSCVRKQKLIWHKRDFAALSVGTLLCLIIILF